MVKHNRHCRAALCFGFFAFLTAIGLSGAAKIAGVSPAVASEVKRNLSVKAQANGVVRYKQARNTKPKTKPGGRIMVPVTSTGIVRYQAPPGCPEGSERIGEKCVKACPAAMYRYRGSCLCPEGLKKRGNQCIEVAAPPPTTPPPPPANIKISPPKLLAGRLGEEYPETTVVATGGRRPYTFARVDGALPPGIELSEKGRISGTPTRRGVFAFVVEATDRNKAIGERSYTLVVEGCAKPQISRDGVCVTPPKITMSPAELPGGEAETKYSGSQLRGSGGSRPYIFELTQGELPPGLKLSDLGELSGTPTKTGAFTFSIKAYDAQDFEGVRRYTIRIAAAEKKAPEKKDPPRIVCGEGMVLFGANCIPDGTKVVRDPPKKPRPKRRRPEKPIVEKDESDDREVVVALQNQLSRLGCLRGRVDGVWGGGSRSALSRFVSKARLSRINRRDPTWKAVSAARKKPRGYCRERPTPTVKPTPVAKPRPCRRGFYRNDNGTCIRECRRGFYLARNGKCVRERVRPRPCEANAYRNREGDCVCRNRFIYRGGRCIPKRKSPPVLVVCADNEILRKGECYLIRCNPAYVARRGKCVPRRKPPVKPPVLIVCGDNQVMREGKCYPIRCNQGYVARRGRCVPIRCKRGTVLRQGRCVTISCQRGTVLQQGRCVRVQPKCVGGQYYDRKRRACRCEGTRVFDRRQRRCVSRQQLEQPRRQQRQQQRGGNNKQQREARCLAICKPRFLQCMRQTNNNRPACMQQAKQCVRAAGC